MSTKLFSELGLSDELLKAIDKLGYEKASPIQAEAIPVMMQGHDVVGQSQTGSGKTAAFAIPAIEKVIVTEKRVQVLVLSPTRELAVQVSEEIHKLALFKRGIHALPIYGGQSYERQFSGLKQGAQIVIGTPGRLMDHMRRGTLRLDAIKIVILDEADVMLDMGFREDIEFILQAVPKERQTVFFSATMPRAIQELIKKFSRDPQTIQIEQKAMTVPTVEQVFYEVDRRFKIELLTRLIDIHDLKLGIIFCNTKSMVDDLVDHLNAQGYSADRLHGDMNQNMRDRVMNKFRKSGLEFLVATDVAARGIDVDDVQVVFNYDLPYDPEDYVHRIGRTGRAGRSGRAISFVAGRELFQISHIERFTRMRIQRGKIPTVDEVEEARASATLQKLRDTLQKGEFKKQDHLISRLLEEGFSSTDIAAALLHHLQASETLTPARPQREEEIPARREPPRSRGDGFGRRDERPDQRGGDRFSGRDDRSERPPRGREIRPPMERAPRAEVRRPLAPPRDPVQPRAVRVQAAPVQPKAPAPAPVAPPAAAPEPVAATAPKVVEPAKKKSDVKIPERRPTEEPVRAPKHSRRTPEDMTRLYMNVGEEMGVQSGDVVGTILGETGLPSTIIGAVDIRERHLFVDVAADEAKSIISKLNRTSIKGNKLKVKVA
ncbi:MAG: cshA [Verrucomicrobiales bacterium]|nr:cshA [Verrucomicrobiales bacterium]